LEKNLQLEYFDPEDEGHIKGRYNENNLEILVFNLCYLIYSFHLIICQGKKHANKTDGGTYKLKFVV
jgi:hypothetical protein